ncbi:aspartyl protease family protein [Pontibacter ramchanderi]|uniref:Aspartyl protease n=1 Tax=Pontibacter ramchanderi TaxID=1179743 RepID=A0A2N3V1Z1_9BACT|nr:aspartyl protease family protein [Pontibacter ramchanderi]PKV75596.1 aspartyl protease [Pontibacter ramchanderi]
MARFSPFLLLCLCCCLFLSEAVGQAFANDTVFFSTKRKSVTIPFKLVHNLIIIPIQINNSNELNFILDSGVKNTLITRLHYSDSLSLNEAGRITIQGLGTGHELEAIYSKGNFMRMPGIEGVNHEVYVLLEDVFNLSTRMGMPIHGIIGYDIFRNFIVKINYSSKTLTLYRPDIELKVPKKAEVYPLHIENTKAYVEAGVRQHNGDSIKVKLVIDTGASHSISLYLPTDERLQLPPKVMEAYLGRGLSGDINGKIGRINSFSLGRYELQNLPASYPDEESIKAALNLANRNGNLGSDILKRFTVIFDYPHQRMMLMPNSKYREPFYYNMTGFEISTPLPGANFYVVSHVIDDSPAKASGLLPGDQLININGRDCKQLALDELLELFDSKPGRKVKLKLKRDSKLVNVEMVLQSRI